MRLWHFRIKVRPRLPRQAAAHGRITSTALTPSFDDDYYVPATGWFYLDLYLMGLITAAEVPDFFLLRNLVPAGRGANGHPIFKAHRVKVTIQDLIAAEGPRLPAVDQSQKNFNTGMVVIVEHGPKPSRELLERANGIRLQWMDYWSTTTGHRPAMTTNVQ